MKYLLFCVLFISSQSISAQGCFPDGETFFNQTSLELDMAENPDCKVIEGYLTLSFNVTDLTPLSNIEVIQGALTIRTAATSLAGLESIDSIYGDLIIRNNDELVDASAFQNLRYLGGNLILENNPILTSAPLFPNLETFEGSIIQVNSNAQMMTLPNFSKLKAFDGHIEIDEMPISNLSGLDNWERIGQLTLSANANLTTTAGLSNLTEISGPLNVISNAMLTTLELPAITHLGELNMNSQRNLVSIEADQLAYLGGNIELDENYELQQLDLPNLVRLEGRLDLDETVNITAISLPELLVIGDDLEMRWTDNMTVLQVPKLDSILGKLNLQLTEIADLDFANLRYAGDVEIVASDVPIETLDFSSLHTIIEDFRIRESTIPENLTMSSLQSVGDDIQFYECDGLVNLSMNATTLDGITLEDIPQLKTVSIPMVESMGQLFMRDNDELVSMDLANLITCESFSVRSEKLEVLQLDKLEYCESGIFLLEMNNLHDLNINFLTKTGSLTIHGADVLGDLTFPVLDTLEGSLKISGDSITGIYFPQLKFIGADLEFGGAEVIDVQLPELTVVEENVTISGLNKLEVLSVPKLASTRSFNIGPSTSLIEVNFASLNRIDGFLSLKSFDALETLDLSSLEYIRYQVTIRDLEVLKDLTFPSLDSIWWFNISHCDSLEHLSMDNLSVIEFFLSFDELNNLQNIHFPNLKQIGERFDIRRNDNLRNISLPQIKKIGEELTIEWNRSLTNIDVPQLDSIEALLFSSNHGYKNLLLDDLKNADFISVQRSDSLLSCSFKSLDVNNQISISDNERLTSIDISNEKILSDGITINQNEVLSELKIQNIEQIGGLLRMHSNDDLTAVDWPKLQSIGSLEIQNFDGLLALDFPQLTTIGGETEIQFNDELVSINWGLLDNTGGEFFIKVNDKLLDINNASLQTIGGDLDIRGNAILEDLIFPKLNFIDGKLWIFDHPELINIDMLALHMIHGALVFDGNAKLTSLEGVANIDPISILAVGGHDLNIRNNPLLSMCSVPSVCGVIFDPDKSIVVNGNAEGCENIEALDCEALTFGGDVFYDKNNNGLRDPDENGISYFPVRIEETNVLTYPGASGRYFQIGEDGNTYTLSLDLEDIWEITTNESSYTFVFEEGSAEFSNFDFGIRYIEPVFDGKVNLTSETTRCNTEVDHTITYQHLSGGYDNTDVVFIEFEIDPQSTFVSSSHTLESFDQNIGIIRVEDVATFDKISIDLVIAMPDEMSTGDLLSNTVEVYVMDQANPTETIDIASYTYEAIVRCSYDPNDKNVNPVGVQDENYTLWDELLTYTIRFQNTGNAEALDVEILDTIDAALDMETFKVVASSHDVVTNILDRSISFLFRDINLPDSTSNEPESHGFITYEIRPNETITDPTLVENTAHIIFDFNPPIVTNTTQNTLVEMIPAVSVKEEETILPILKPNPATSHLTIEIDQFEYVEILDMTGRLVLASRNRVVDIRDLEEQVYVVRVKTANGVGLSKLVVAR